MTARKEKIEAEPAAFCGTLTARRADKKKSWRRWVKDEVPLEGHRVIMFCMHVLALSIDHREKKKPDLGWSLVYRLFLTLDQVVADGGRWERGYPLLHVDEPPDCCQRRARSGLTVNPMSKLCDPEAAALLLAWQRDMKTLAENPGNPRQQQQQQGTEEQQQAQSARSKSRAAARARKAGANGGAAPPANKAGNRPPPPPAPPPVK
jgi:hypothetical protein